ncbi:MAG: DUF2723 domain-containing protein [Chloroflexota bacterium]
MHTRIHWRRWWPRLLFLAALTLYLCTLAPTISWGDSARLQRQAYQLDLSANHPFYHPLWVALAHPFTRLPLGDVAWRVNLFTALCAALTAPLVYGALAAVAPSPLARLAGCGALLVSHCFWMHAARAEVYSLNLLLYSFCLWCLLAGKLAPWRAVAAGLAAGVAVSHHAMLWAAVPGFAILLIARLRGQPRCWAWGALAAAAFLAPVVAYRLVFRQPLGASLNPLDYVPTLATLRREVPRLAAYVILQLPSPALALAVVGARRAWRQPALGAATALTCLLGVVAALNLAYSDKYVFYGLSFFILALWVAPGWEAAAARLAQRMPRPAQLLLTLLLASLVIVPPVAYAALPRLLPAVGVTARTLGIREVPERPALAFFFTPWRRGDDGARRFAAAALTALPENAVLLADATIGQPLLYLQQVEGVRPDVRVSDQAPAKQVAYARRVSPAETVYLAHTDALYDVQGLSAHFRLVPEGPVVRLELPR